MWFLWELFWLIAIGYILFLVFSRSRKYQIPGLSPLTLFLAILIFIAATILFNVIWDDLSELVRVEEVDYLRLRFNELLVHALYVIPLLIAAVVLYVGLEKRGVKYRVLTFPYFAAASIMMVRWLIDAGYLAIERFERAGIYGVLFFVLVVFTALIFYIQGKREK